MKGDFKFWYFGNLAVKNHMNIEVIHNFGNNYSI
jgi:hypothetical protein